MYVFYVRYSNGDAPLAVKRSTWKRARLARKRWVENAAEAHFGILSVSNIDAEE